MVFRNNEVDKLFFTPRDYQLELVDKALSRNIIVPLGTGSGKTFIAVMLIRELAAEIIPPLKMGGKRSFFLVDKVPLVEQQADHIKHHTNLTVGKFHGKMNVDYFSDEQWRKIIEENQVMVMTAQIFVHLIDHGLFAMEKANLLVFDECHHALGKQHPYRVIMDRYRRLEPGKVRPRILGLTASVINNKTPPHKLEALMIDLERALDCRIETASDLMSVSKYGAKPKIHVVTSVNFDADVSPLCVPVIKWLNGLKEFCHFSNQFQPEFDVDPRRPVIEALERTTAILRQLGPWCAWKVCLIWEKQLKKLCKQPTLGRMQELFLTMGETYIRGARRMLEPELRHVRTLNEVKRFLPDRLNRLLDILRFFNEVQKKNSQGDKKAALDDFSGIIFVEQRYVAYIMKVLLKAICKWDEGTFGYLKVDFVIGYSGYNIASEETMALHRRQEEVLRKFRLKQLNLLVATSVLEEGVDVRQCNVVIRFDRPKDYRSFVQSKGRARKENSSYFALVEERDSPAFTQDLRDFEQIEQILLKRYHSSHNPAAEAVDTEIADSIMPAYEVNTNKELKGVVAGNARVTMSTAIALVNRYCAKLPSDIFTRLVPQCVIKPVQVGGQTKYIAELTLPINSPVKEVIRSTIPMDRKKYAQMAVALKACQVLHERKELTDNLLPVGKDTIAKLLTQLDDDPDEWVPNLRTKVGSAKRKQLYDKRMAKALNGALPLPDETSYMYIIDLTLTKPASKEANPKNRKIVDPHDSERCFGLLSKKKLPPVPAFPIFLRQGEVKATIRRAPVMISVSEADMALLQLFHSYIFGEVLRLDKFGMLFNPQNAPVNVLIMPLRKIHESSDVTYVFDYAYVNTIVKKIGNIPNRPDDTERRKFVFDAEKFSDAIVMPFYRNRESPHFYYVAEICHGLTPASSFPDNQFMTFNEYFKAKWGLEIYSQTQPLLDVDYTSSRLNLLTPRFYNRNGKVLKSAMERAAAAASDSTQKQILVPELVDVHPISASLWNMIVALPSILYRVNSLLLADELRQTVMREAFQAQVLDPPEDFEWEPLDYGWPTDDVVPNSTDSSQTNQYALATEDAYDRHKSDNEKADKLVAKLEEQQRQREECFEIGIWNPELAEELNLGPTLPWEQSAPRLDHVEDETAGLMSSGLEAPSSLADDFEDDEDDILFKLDFKNSVSEKLREKGDLFAPNPNIEPTGWDDPGDDFAFPVNGDVGLPLQFVSVGKQFDLTALQKDVESQVVVSVVGSAAASNSNGASTEPATNTMAQQQQQQQLWLDTMEMLDDSDRRRADEETIDLSAIENAERDADEQLVGAMLAPPQLSDVSFCGLGESMNLSADKPAVSWSGIEEAIDDDEVEKTVNSARPAVHLPVKETDSTPADTNLNHTAKMNFPPELSWMKISFEEDKVAKHPYGVSPCLLLQALTMSNASDGINLERLETVGDSFLKYAVTVFLYCTYTDMHEGKLSFGRSKEVSNCNLYRLGKKRLIPHLMVAAKFDPQDSWLPPCYVTTNDFKAPNSTDAEEDDRRMEAVLEGKEMADQQLKVPTGWDEADANNQVRKIADGVETINLLKAADGGWEAGDDYTPLPYNLLTQQNISDKAIADSVEALIGAHLLTFGPDGALKFMTWLGLNVLPKDGGRFQMPDPLLHFADNPMQQLNDMWQQFQFSKLEQTLHYRFKQRAYLVQAFTHASYYKNRITGCYQRLEFLGDAVLDYVITRFLFEHKNQYSPGVLTDLRSALVNNTIFASLAVKFGFHKYFIAMCPGLHGMIEKFVKLCEEKNVDSANFNDELYMVTEEEIDEGEEEDIEVPKAMGDIFESVAGAVYLDSGCSLNAVWRVFAYLMKDTIRECCNNPPKSPIRELLEMEPERARFAKLERIIATGKVRVTVDVQNKCRFTGMGRSYRIAKCTAAKRALRYLKSLDAQKLKDAKAKKCRT